MKFRPCIDIHNGKVKQIVGGSLQDAGSRADENFVSERPASYFAGLYREDGLTGGHVILLNKKDGPFYAETLAQGLGALAAYPGGLQIGGGVTAKNAPMFLEKGASHVIVTTFLFRDGEFCVDRLFKLADTVGKDRIVIDLSCRRQYDSYVVVTDRWQHFTKLAVTPELLGMLEPFCAEFLIHGVDAEGKRNGMEEELVARLSEYDGNPVTYAGGIHSRKALGRFREVGRGRLDYTVGSALDLFGGKMSYRELVEENRG
ncbi:MAG: phosphoribosylformimino-5-aminoimidazole carboxamide ribotide isomerase [Lachnospiraceae bacterium]|nr:phosphoribosylformimino-5-aminoimidazole carboxamide ribotide isomerase [Lachnospiraceae bacterium]